MPNYNVGTAKGEIVLDYDGTGARQAEGDLKNLTKGGMSTEAALRKTSTAMIGAGSAIAGGLALAVNAAANFEQRLSAVKAVSGATEPEMEKLRAKAMQLGRDTAFSAVESASAMEELVKAGLSVDDVLNGAADATVALAAAGEIDLPQAATIASNAMNQFNLSAQDMPKVADLIAGAANASAIDVGEFGQSLQQVGAVANLAGVSFDDTATAIALLGNAGIRGSDAGTSLKSMFQRLNPQTAEARDLMKELGIITADGANTFYDAEGNMKGLADVSQILQDSLSGMTAEQKQATLQTLFGADAIRAAAILTDQGAAGFENMAASMAKVSAADVAAEKLNNFKGSLTILKGSLETAAITVGQVFLPILKNMVDGLTGVVNAFASLPPGVIATIGVVAAIVAALLIAIGVFIKIGLAVQNFLMIWRALSLAFLANPIGIVIAIIIGLIAALVLLYQRSETVRNIIQQAWAGIQQAIGVAVAFIKAAIAQFIAGFQGVQGATSGVMGFFNQLGASVQRLAQWFMGTAVPAIVAFIQALASRLLPILTAVANFIVGNFLPAIMKIGQGLIGFLQPVIAGIVSAIQKIVPALGPVVSAIGSLIMAIVPLFGALIAIIIKIASVVLSILAPAFQFLAPIIGQVIGFIISAIGSIIAVLLKVVAAVIKFVADVIKFFTNLFMALVGGSIIPDLINGIVKWFLSLPGKILGMLAGFVSSVISYFANLGARALAAIVRFVSQVVNGFVNLRARVIATVANFVSTIVARFVAFAARVVAVIVQFIARAVQFFSTLPGRARAAIAALPGLIVAVATNAFSRFLSAVTSGAARVVSLARGIPGRIRGALGNLGSLLYSAGRSVIQGLINGISSMVGAVGRAVSGVASTIRNFLPFSPAKEGPLRKNPPDESGEEIVRMLVAGMASQRARLAAEVARLAATMPNTIGGVEAAITASAQRTGGRTVAERVVAAEPVSGAALIGTQNVYNPIAEPASQTAARQASRYANMGGAR